jgi:FixJ family two-component response regulator
VTKLTTPVEFDALLLKMQRAMRGADDVDAASALVALLFHRLTLLTGEQRQVAREALASMLRHDARTAENLALIEGPRRARLLRALH